jgi:hypothetical protein
MLKYMTEKLYVIVPDLVCRYLKCKVAPVLRFPPVFECPKKLL